MSVHEAVEHRKIGYDKFLGTGFAQSLKVDQIFGKTRKRIAVETVNRWREVVLRAGTK
jgi:hypothetical protein